MLEKIIQVKEAAAQFIQYLHERHPCIYINDDNVKNWSNGLVIVLGENARATIEKLNKLERYLGVNANNGAHVDPIVYKKLIEYISRIQEAIQGCLYRDHLELTRLSLFSSDRVEQDKLQEYGKQLNNLSQNLAKILPIPPVQNMQPRKHWLNNDWKMAEEALQMQSALNMVCHPDNPQVLELCKTVVFSAKNRPHVLNYTGKTTELTQPLSGNLTGMHAFHQNSTSIFEHQPPRARL